MQFSMAGETRTDRTVDAVWSTDKIARLTELYTTTNFSFSQMATMLNTEFGTSLSRNAVIGKMNRLGIKDLRSNIYKNKGGTERRKPPKQAKARTQMLKLAEPPSLKSATPGPQGTQHDSASLQPDFVDEPTSFNKTLYDVQCEPITLLELETGRCHWPLGEVVTQPPYLYCGGGTVKDCPYCPAHAAIAFAPMSRNIARAYTPIRRYRR